MSQPSHRVSPWIALCCAGSVSASCCFCPCHDHTPSLTRFGQGASVCPRAPSAIRSTSYPSRTGRPSTSYVLMPPPTATMVARWPRWRISCCAPLGGSGASVTRSSCRGSVVRRVEGAQRDRRQRPALATERSRPERRRLVEESVAGQRVDHVPGTFADLVLQLTG